MADDLERLHQALAARLQRLGIALDDPRIQTAMAQAQVLLQRHAAAAAPSHAAARSDDGGSSGPTAIEALPSNLKEMVQDYIRAVRTSPERVARGMLGSAWFTAAPAL